MTSKKPPTRGLPYGPIRRSEIDLHVPKNDNTMGVYFFGPLNEKGKLVPRYVGRSDNHKDGLNGRIHDYDGKPPKHAKWPWMKYEICESLSATFDLECTLYHLWGDQLINKIHPRRPHMKNWPCPIGGHDCFKENS